MKRINDISDALKLFEDAALKHAEATETGDYKTANKNYDKIVEAIQFLKEKNQLDGLLKFLNHDSDGVRVWAAGYLLFTHSGEGVRTLEEISKTKGIQSLNASTTLSE